MVRKTQFQIKEDMESVYKALDKYPEATASELSHIVNLTFIYTRSLLEKLIKVKRVKISNHNKNYRKYIVSK